MYFGLDWCTWNVTRLELRSLLRLPHTRAGRCGLPEVKKAQQGARANDHGCHDPCSEQHGSRQPRSWLIFDVRRPNPSNRAPAQKQMSSVVIDTLAVIGFLVVVSVITILFLKAYLHRMRVEPPSPGSTEPTITSDSPPPPPNSSSI
jgi:hypothetical protein